MKVDPPYHFVFVTRWTREPELEDVDSCHARPDKILSTTHTLKYIKLNKVGALASNPF
jgi:hypothetical protein